MKYRFKEKPDVDDDGYERTSNFDVFRARDWWMFNCPCGQRDVFLGEKHTVSFDSEGLMNVQGSIGSNPMSMKQEKWEKNHCHFFIKEGEYQMCDDAKCPGKHLK